MTDWSSPRSTGPVRNGELHSGHRRQPFGTPGHLTGSTVMTVTPLRQHTAGHPRRHHTRPSLISSRPAHGGPDALTVSFAVTLAGEDRYRNALEVVDGLRQLAGRLTTDGLVEVPLDAVSLDVTPLDNPPFVP